MTPQQQLRLLSFVPIGTIISVLTHEDRDAHTPGITGAFAGLASSKGEDLVNVQLGHQRRKAGVHLRDVAGILINFGT